MSNAPVLSGAWAFSLSDTHGFPLDLAKLEAHDRGLGLDEPGYEHELRRQRARAKGADIGPEDRGVLKSVRRWTRKGGPVRLDYHPGWRYAATVSTGRGKRWTELHTHTLSQALRIACDYALGHGDWRNQPWREV